jgi:hypothetical protein
MMALASACAPVPVPPAYHGHCLGSSAVRDVMTLPSRFPLRLLADGDAVGGRGLAVVEALSSRWGWHPVSRPGLVKVVWAEWSSALRKP